MDAITRKQLIDVFEFGTRQIVEIYKITTSVLLESIKAGKNNVPLGLLAFQTYNDLLHGGAYTEDIESIPYYSPNVQSNLNFQQLTLQSGFVQYFNPAPLTITLPSGQQIALPKGAKPEQIEAILDSNVRHRFPKIISDQTYYLNKEWISLFFQTDLFKSVSTSLSTLVEGVGTGIESALGGLSGRTEQESELIRANAALIAAERAAAAKKS